MRLTFRLRYHTWPGQSLWLTGPHEIFGKGDTSKAVPLDYLDDQTWQACVFIPDAFRPKDDLVYSYLLRQPDGAEIQDWGNDRVLNLAKLGCDELLVIDAWNHPGFVENAFFTEPFQEVLLKARQPGNQIANEASTVSPALAGQLDRPGADGMVTHQFKVKAPLLRANETLCLLGNHSALGNWSTASPILLARKSGEPFLTAAIDLSPAAFPISYKYGVYDAEKDKFLRFEEGANRVLNDSIRPGKLTIVNDGFALLPSNSWKGAGVAIPVFSLRTESSFGVGEFSDLKKFADWCAKTGLQLIQILPVNDTTATHTWTDSYPYAAISAFALHPIYLNLAAVADPKNKPLVSDLEPERQRLNALEVLDYEAVMRTKVSVLKQLFALQKDRTFRSKEYREFFERNRDWLVPYALFCYLRDQYGTVDFIKWPAHRQFVQTTISAGSAPGSTPPATADPIAFYYFIQFHLHRQLSEAAHYAHQKGIILKGDIAIGVYRHGADAWQSPELYHLAQQAGAPPDAFARKGQNWGFPTYNWSRMRETGYAWWTRRFEQMSRYFDAFRIDHILGFFRIWSVPLSAVEGIMGHFVPALPVHPDEFLRRGIRFDPARFTRPYITDQVIDDIFGAGAPAVKRDFLNVHQPGIYQLKPQFATQRQVQAYFDALETTDRAAQTQEGLFDLISNVLLFEEANSEGQRFHFRFAIETTTSFQALDPQTRAQVWELYLDYYFRRQDEFWRKQGLEKLPALKRATNMLVCGEDLGLVPGCVPEVMRDLGLLGLEIQRMPKVLHHDFSRPQEAPYLSVVTPSTHDMSTIRGWWHEDRAVIQKFFNRELGLPGLAPEECDVTIVREIVRQHLASPAMWSIFQLQDLLGMDEQLRRKDVKSERINVPANPKNYWRYRMHLPVESLLQTDGFNQFLRGQLAAHGRLQSV